jgi:hypothetical protein
MPNADLVQRFAEARGPATRLGFLNEDGTPGPRWYDADNPMRANPLVRKIMDPQQQPKPAYAYAQAIAPRTIMEIPPTRFLGDGSAIEISRFALNPGEAFYRQLLPGAAFAYAPPRMFASGDLPLLTASGVDPSILVYAAWYLRHSAALTDSRAHVLEIVEESATDVGPDPEALQIESGRDRWADYFSRISRWVSTPPQNAGVPSGAESLHEQMVRLYGPGAGE